MHFKDYQAAACITKKMVTHVCVHTSACVRMRSCAHIHTHTHTHFDIIKLVLSNATSSCHLTDAYVNR